MTLMPWRSVARCTLTATLSLQASSGFVTLLSSKTLSTSATASSTSSSHELSDLHGKASKWLLLSARREERIEALTGEGPLTEGEQAELAGLRDRSARFEEQYNDLTFSPEHVKFKDSHNLIFLALVKYCSRRASSSSSLPSPVNAFYLDGPTAGTTLVLRAGGVDLSHCFVANRHAKTCQALVGAGLPAANVAHAWAAEALRRHSSLPDGHGLGTSLSVTNRAQDAGTQSNDRNTSSDGSVGSLSDIEFGAFYFDGCGGHAPVVADMVAAALSGRSSSGKGATGKEGKNDLGLGSGGTIRQFSPPSSPVAVGFSLVGGNRDVADKELAVVRRVVELAKEAGFARVVHVLDDPSKFGVDPHTRKVDASTLTTWLVLEP